MRTRPRCHTWLPLSTQQLRLRNLIRVKGVNIKCQETGALIYYTLHETVDKDAFYTSECLPDRQDQNWAEIICPKIFKANDRSVCVKVWAQYITCLLDNNNVQRIVGVDPLSALTNELVCAHKDMPTNSKHKLLFTWGINFSGLMPLSEQTCLKLKENSLVFYINGSCFTSAEHIISDITIIYKFLALNEEFPNNTKIRPNSNPKSVDEVNADNFRNGVTARYIVMYFKKDEVRKGYNLYQLLKLQEKQRICLQKVRESRDLTVEIQRSCVQCITKDQLSIPLTSPFTNTFTRNSQRTSMGRALSELFSEQRQIRPQTLYCAQKLKKQLETLRLKQRLLQSEHRTISLRLAQETNRLSSLIEIRQRHQLSIRSRNLQLQGEKKVLVDQYQEIYFLTQKKIEVIRNMERRMSALCVGLREIYPIETKPNGFNTINNVTFPSMDALINDTKSHITSNPDNILPITLSVSLGYIAHLVQMIAYIFNRPLRNAIIHQGSRSRIIDIVKEIPLSCSEFPLYNRSAIPSKAVKYGIFLLNQNIAQLCYDIIGLRCDMSLTLENINQIFVYLSEVQSMDEKKMYRNKKFVFSYNGCINMDNNILSNSHSSIDMNNVSVPLVTVTPENCLLQLTSNMPFSIEGGVNIKQRISRSVGSYSDSEDDFKDIRVNGFSNSDSNLANPSKHI
ncbi:UV radiation resistance-associated gene protein [Zeugodacus cucurbitae]|uniref:UV radiation resistance-associated gene protein n=1 Tax=Zeugodacus cucurbitae TaxID=28588 RepID=UPI0023D938AF|nr:UV radiation resistance-associated gene protein [Zeugodacus cucurbitae]